MERNRIQLLTNCILNVPFQMYDNDFTFIVNGNEFKTNKIISDLLSPKICNLHQIDPTFDTFVINTKYNGYFSFFLNLINFNQQEVPEEESEFISEVIEILCNELIKVIKPLQDIEITFENVFDFLKLHEKNIVTFSDSIQKEVEFIASHFYEINEEQEEQLKQLSTETIELILKNSHLELIDEEQLLLFI